jgi:AcrR family transcriptional regulator
VANTRTRILVNSLVLFNEQGEAKTTTNEIADETDISPGNLHYHFRKKSDLIDALIGEFQADARQVLQAPAGDESAVDEFWGFLQLLVEVLTAYRFLIRDAETMVARYPQVGRAMKGFLTGLMGVLELHIAALDARGIIDVSGVDRALLARSIAILAIYSQRLDATLGQETSIEEAAGSITGAAVGQLLPYAPDGAAEQLQALMQQYQHN